MRLVLVCQEYPPARVHGGIGTQAEIKARWLAERGHDVRVVAAGGAGREERARSGGVEVVRLAAPDERLPIHTDAARWMAWSLEVAAALERLAAERPFDLVEFAEYGAEGYAWLLNRAPWSRIPALVQLHGPLAMLAANLGWPEPGSLLHRVGLHMEETCLRLADALYSSSACSARAVEDAYGIAAKALPVLHAGVETERFRPAPALSGPAAGVRRVVFAGRLAASKGVEELLAACLALAPEVPGLVLRVIGGGDPRLERLLVDRARAAGRPELLELAGFVARDALPGALAAGSVFALPSRYEGGPGMACLEAMACGLPAVVCRGSGAEEAVRDGASGVLVPPGDAAALTAALRRLLLDPELRARMGREARRQVEAEASAAAMVPRIESLYQDVIARAASRGAP